MFLAGILKEARKGGEDLVQREDPAPEDESKKQLTAAEEAMAKNILDMIQKNRQHDRNLAQQEEQRLFESDIPKDINGNANDTGEAVHWHPHTTQVTLAAGIPYLVMDIDHICNQCTMYKKCERHRKPHRVKTDVSLCKANHLRMAIEWDITDAENRKGTWTFRINEQYNRLDDPERERENHAFYEKRKAEGASDKIQVRGCRPIDPKWRIKELAARMVEDHNKEMEAKARQGNLDPKGREHYTRRKDWGPKDPIKPTEAGSTRAAWEYKTSLDNTRIELELRALLQAWYKSKLSKDERGSDRTSLNAKAIWKQKMQALEMREAERAIGEPLDASELSDEEIQSTRTVPTSSNVATTRTQVERAERYRSTTTVEQQDARIAAKKAALEEEQKLKKAKKAAKAKAKRAAKKAALEDEEKQAEAAEAKAKRDGKKAPSKRKAIFADSSDSEFEQPVKKTRVVEKNETVEAVPAPDDELSPEQIAIFEQMAADAEDEASGKKKTEDKSTAFQKPRLQAAARDFTAEERKLLQSIKQKQEEVVHSEEDEEPEPEPEVEEEETGDEVEESKPKISKPKISKLQKVAEVSPLPTPAKKPSPKKPKADEAPKTSPKPKVEKRKASTSPSNSDPPAKKTKKEKTPPKPNTPKPKKEPATPKTPKPKRKASTSPNTDEPAAKKTRRTYKSSATIENSDDEADYELPAAPALELPEQREGWKFTEALSEEVEESIMVVQTNKKKKVSKAEGLVVEQGTTIMKRVDSEKAESPKLAVVEEAAMVERDGEKTSFIEAVSEGEGDDDLSAPQSPFSEVTSSLKKRRTSFDGEEKPAKKAKKVSFEEDVVDVERKRKMSIEYTINRNGKRVYEDGDEERRVIQSEATDEDVDVIEEAETEVEVVAAVEDDEDEPEVEEDDENYNDLFEE